MDGPANRGDGYKGNEANDRPVEGGHLDVADSPKSAHECEHCEHSRCECAGDPPYRPLKSHGIARFSETFATFATLSGPAQALGNGLAAATRQTLLPASSATSRPPLPSTTTPTGRPCAFTAPARFSGS